MAAELEKLARDLAIKGYVDAALRLQKEATVLKEKGLIPDALNEIAELTPQQIATRVYNLAAFLDRIPNPTSYADTLLEFQDKQIRLHKSRVGYDEHKKQDIMQTTLYSGSEEWIPNDLSSGGIVFETNISDSRKQEVQKLGVDADHVISIGMLADDTSRAMALELVEHDDQYKGRFETTYYIGKDGSLVKLCLVPTVMDIRPDVFDNPIDSLGLKRIQSTVTPQDLVLINDALDIFEPSVIQYSQTREASSS